VRGKKTPSLLLLLAMLWLVLARHMPMEEAVGGPLGAWWLVVKSSFTFLALLPMLWGWGIVSLIPLRKIASVIVGIPTAAIKMDDLGLWTGCSLLLGVAVVGLFTFAGGLIWPPSWSSALPLVAGGNLLAALAWRSNGLGWRHSVAELTDTYQHQITRQSKLWLWLLLAVVALRCSMVFFFQGHEDAYIYHLSAAESWLQRGHTGVFVTNIYTGYALAVEHYYLFLKILAVGNAEQNALAQISHLICGYGTFVWALLTLARPWLNRRERAAFVLICMHTWLVFFMLLPKNDGYLAGAAALALVGIARGVPTLFLAGASVAMIMKPTAGLTFAAIGVADLLTRPELGGDHGRAFATHLRLLLTGALLMIAEWAPFGLRNAYVTGNPFFPLLSELFPTPYAPELSRVITEAEPFKLSVVTLFNSLSRLLISDITITIGLLTCIYLVATRRTHFVLKPFFASADCRFLLVFSTIAFFILQLFCGEFGKQVESRHFLAMLGPLMVIGVALLVQATPESRRRKVTPVVIALMGILYSNFDVALRDLYRGLSGDGVTFGLFEHKPNMLLNHHLSRLISKDATSITNTATMPRVFANTICNAEYFLSNAEFWHIKKTYPAWTWNVASLSGTELTRKLYEANISYAITDSSSPLALSLATISGSVLIQRAGSVELWRLR